MKPTWRKSKTVENMFVAIGKKYTYGYHEGIKIILIDTDGKMRVTLQVDNLERAKMIAHLLEKTTGTYKRTIKRKA